LVSQLFTKVAYNQFLVNKQPQMLLICGDSMKKSKIDRLLLPLFGSQELIDKWWKTQNKAFSNKTPEEVFIKDPSLVVTYIFSQYK
jgi:hypothetical protein